MEIPKTKEVLSTSTEIKNGSKFYQVSCLLQHWVNPFSIRMRLSSEWSKIPEATEPQPLLEETWPGRATGTLEMQFEFNA